MHFLRHEIHQKSLKNILRFDIITVVDCISRLYGGDLIAEKCDLR